jgi:hypothetical protein
MQALREKTPVRGENGSCGGSYKGKLAVRSAYSGRRKNRRIEASPCLRIAQGRVTLPSPSAEPCASNPHASTLEVPRRAPLHRSEGSGIPEG